MIPTLPLYIIPGEIAPPVASLVPMAIGLVLLTCVIPLMLVVPTDTPSLYRVSVLLTKLKTPTACFQVFTGKPEAVTDLKFVPS